MPKKTQAPSTLSINLELGVSEAASLFGAGRYTCEDIRVMSRLYVKVC